ncbi:MAG: leucine-rich repeat protein [Candidatus Coproplasma sp.]
MKYKFCPECGYKFEREFKFCPECGLSLADGQPEAKENKQEPLFDFLEDTAIFEAGFDRQLEELSKKEVANQAASATDGKIKKAFSLCLRGMFDKALKLYDEVLDEDGLNLNALIGIVCASSKNYENEYPDVERDIKAVIKVAGGITEIKDADFKNYVSRCELNKKKAAEQEAAKKRAEEAAKRKAEETARKKAAEEEAARKKAAEREAAKKRAEEEAARKKAEREEKKRAEQEAKKRAAEEYPTLNNYNMATLDIEGTTLIKYSGRKTKVLVPDGVTEISASAFKGRKIIESVVIPDSVEKIGAYAFSRCYRLSEISFGTGLKHIVTNAFYDCKSLKSATFQNPNGWNYYEPGSYSLGVSVSSDSMADPSEAAANLKKYSGCNWKRKGIQGKGKT